MSLDPPSEADTEGGNRVTLADPSLGERERKRAGQVLESGALADGAEVRAFESEFAEYCDTSRGVATANGTAALHAALDALDIGPGDTVVTTPLSFVATANAVRFVGAEPVFADVDPVTYNIDPEAVEAVIRDRGGVDALLVVHLYGLPADMGPLVDIADSHGIPLIEDAAQAHGATYNGKRVGSFGDAATFSFYPTKNMTTGEGGMVVTDRDDVATRASRFVNHGRGEDGAHVDVGYNYRMTNVAAAIGRVQLERLPSYTRRRQRHAAELTDALAETGFTPPTEPDDRTHVYHQYTIRCKNRESVREVLDEFDVDSGVYYPSAIHQEPAYEGSDPDAPAAERAAEEVLSLPIHPGLSDSDLRTVGLALEYATRYAP